MTEYVYKDILEWHFMLTSVRQTPMSKLGAYNKQIHLYAHSIAFPDIKTGLHPLTCRPAITVNLSWPSDHMAIKSGHHCLRRWLITSLVPIQRRNLKWYILDWTTRNTFRRLFIQNTNNYWCGMGQHWLREWQVACSAPSHHLIYC